MTEQSGRNFKMIASDVADGFITINPIFLKPFNAANMKALYKALEQRQNEVRAEPFPYNDIPMIRKRNIRLQRLYSSLLIVRNYAREKNILMF
jgi:hypothetical protein